MVFAIKKTIHASERDRPDIVEKRKEWHETDWTESATSLVFLDESGVNTDETRHYGRAVGGERVHDATPLNTPKSTTILSSVRMNGETVHTTFSGAVNGEKFQEYLRDHLYATLKPGDIVIMDNLRAHKVQGVQEIIESVGACIVYLPPYSPDLNPIEQMWSKIKAFLRAVKARSVEALLSAIPQAFNTVSVDDIRGWFTCAGYLR